MVINQIVKELLDRGLVYHQFVPSRTRGYSTEYTLARFRRDTDKKLNDAQLISYWNSLKDEAQ